MAKISKIQIEKISDIFHALSNPTRVDILFFLYYHPSSNVSDIVKHTEITQSGVSHQLKILKQNNLVKAHRIGKEIAYSLCDTHVISICSQILSHSMEGCVAKF
ncbi:ArsR/SmtB family transcription factor [Enterococcus faecalis]|uniref:ArsR/SmtB family transcription factor n=1 Tax=Enterococcus faecalis TaxID=1351 RepID=UPI00046C4F76|nr:metalloregulator ArsR/SmtB family transcription factor [Enterococcus faecalis]